MSQHKLSMYDLHERDWDSYEQIREEFEWVVPEEFNMARFVCDRWAETDGERVAVYARSKEGTVQELTYGDLREKADRLANYLAERGIGRGDKVALSAPQKTEMVVACVATWKLGAVAVPFSTLYGREGLRYRLDDSNSKAFVVDESMLDVYREVEDDLDLDVVLTVDADPGEGEREFHDALSAADPDFETTATDPEDDAVIIYTSGTTGDPKGVVHAHQYLLSNLVGHQFQMNNLEFREDDLTMTPVEWSWGATMYVILFPALFYGRRMLAYDRDSFDPEAAFELIDEFDVTNFFAPRTALAMMLREGADDYDLSSLRLVASGGEALDEEIRSGIRDLVGDVAIHEAYGQTEALSIVASANALYEPKPGYVARPLPGVDVEIVDPETAEPVETGEIGEIAVGVEGNPGVFKRYLNKPEKTDEKFANGYMLTEDLGYRDEEGYVGFHSRKDDVIISSGYRISPEEIEESLSKHEAVADVGVVGVPDDERGEIPKAFVVLADGHEGTEELKTDLQEFVKADLAKYEYPRAVAFIDELPTTSTGKLRRKDLKDRE